MFKAVWNFILVVILIYTATYMPYKTCFIDEPSVGSEAIDWTVDGLFLMDIFVNYISAIEEKDGTI